MSHKYSNKPTSFSVFRSAAEEADMRKDEHCWSIEGEHMSCTAGRIVSVRGGGGEQAFQVIMSRAGGETSEHVFATMREAEAFVRRNTPRAPTRSTTYDRESGET